MSLTGRQIVARARNAHPAFTGEVIPGGVALEYCHAAQRKLIRQIHQADPHYLTKLWVIALLPGENLATVGPGTTGEAPLVPGTATLQRRTVPSGAAAIEDPDAVPLVAERAATGGSLSTLIDATRAWTVNAFAGKLVQILSGPAIGQVRQILSNTATAVTVLVATPFDVAPGPDCTYVILPASYLTDGQMAVLQGALPAQVAKLGWLVRLDAQGQPYLDLAAPVTVSIEQGIPLPPNDYVDHGTAVMQVRGSTACRRVQVMHVPPVSRFQPPRSHCYYVRGQQLFIAPPFSNWSNVVSLEIPYLPQPPALTSADDVLMLPDVCEEAMVGMVTLRMLERARSMNAAGPGGGAGVATEANDQISSFMGSMAGVNRSTVDTIVDVSDEDDQW